MAAADNQIEGKREKENKSCVDMADTIDMALAKETDESRREYSLNRTFTRLLDSEGVKSLFGYVEGETGSCVEISETTEAIMQGFMYKKYAEGIALCSLSFGKQPSGQYCGVTLSAIRTPLRIDLIERLGSEVELSIGHYFGTD